MRQLEALVRLSEALARLRCTEKITPTYVREVCSTPAIPHPSSHACMRLNDPCSKLLLQLFIVMCTSPVPVCWALRCCTGGAKVS